MVKALDSKFTVDDNALYRHPEIAAMRDDDAADPLEALARAKHVTYVKLDGEVGVLGNGAGLTMSTVDVVTFAGGRPANFCDLGGGGDAQGVVDALSVITRDPQVKAIFFNIFGGITRCDEVARGILQALGEMSLELPIVVRLDGTNAEEGRRILAEAAPPNLHVAPTMLEAARPRRGAGRMTDVWSERAEQYRTSDAHREGPDLDLIVEWATALGARTALDVATGGGHVARRLREAGIEVVSCDPAPGMQPDVVCRAEDLPFADGELRRRRDAGRRAPLRRRPPGGQGDGARRREGGRRRRQLLHGRGGRGGREAPRPSHVRNYGAEEWRAFSRRPG